MSEVKRPEKQKPINSELGGEILCKGYNIAYDDWEKFLPSISELTGIIKDVGYTGNNISHIISMAIAKRLGGKK